MVLRLDDRTAGQGLVRACNCSFTIPDYWPYGDFRPRSGCALPGKRFVATATGQPGHREAFLVLPSGDVGLPNVYHLDAGVLWVAWRARRPPRRVEGGRFACVGPDPGPWQIACNLDGQGRIAWQLRACRGGAWQEHAVAGAVVGQVVVEAAFDERGEALAVDDWMDAQLELRPRQLCLWLNGEPRLAVEHDAYPAAFQLRLGSAQERAGGQAVETTFRYVYVDDVPYPYDGAAGDGVAEDVRPEDDAFSSLVVPATAQGPRQSEADLVRLRDGTLLLAWSDFHVQRAHDAAPARVSGMRSTDGGRTWSERFVIRQRPEAARCTPDVSMIHTAAGDLLLAYHDHLEGMAADSIVLLRSGDDGATWGEPEPMRLEDGRAFLANNGCFRRLRGGRLLLSCRQVVDGVRWPFAAYSDDDGRTWRAGQTVPDPQLAPHLKQQQNVNEPSVAELADGRLLMAMRTVAGGQYFSASSDGGHTWSRPRLSPLRGVCAPAAIRAIPGTGDVLAVWNYGFGARTPLAAAVSRDGGASWENPKLVERSKYWGYDYPSITFVDDRVYLTYSRYPLVASLQTLAVDTTAMGLMLTILPRAWFYREGEPPCLASHVRQKVDAAAGA